MFLIATRKFLGVEQHRNTGATWQAVIGPAGINAEFSQERSRPPPWMRPAQVHDGIAHSRRKSAERSVGNVGQRNKSPCRVKLRQCGNKVSFCGFIKDISMTYNEREKGEKSR